MKMYPMDFEEFAHFQAIYSKNLLLFSIPTEFACTLFFIKSSLFDKGVKTMKTKKMIIISVSVILLGFLVVCCMPEPESQFPDLSFLLPIEETGTETEEETGSETGTGIGTNPVITDESFFYDSVVAEGNVWMRTSGGLSYDSPTATVYKKFFNAEGSVLGFTIKPNTGGEGYCIYDIGLEYKTYPDLTVNAGFTGGTIVRKGFETLDFAIDKTAKTITVTAKSKPGESVVFSLQETAE